MLLVLVLTHRCDLACTYCYAGPKDDRVMPEAVGRRAVERALLAVHDRGTLRLGLFGGEPLLAWARGRTFVAHARALAAARGVRVEVSLTTNGTHLDERALDDLLAHEVAISVSMDGLPEVHDAGRPLRGGRPSSGAALAAIDRLVTRGVPFQVVSVVRPDSVARVADGARLLADRGVRAIVHSFDLSAPWGPADAPRVQQAVRELRDLWVERFAELRLALLEGKASLLLSPSLPKPTCGVGEGEVAVAPSGRLYPCERLVQDDAPGPFAAGHVDDDDGPLRLARSFSARPGPGTPCAPCTTAPVCANACACANLARTGAPDRPDGLICTLEQAALREARLGLELVGRRRAPRSLPRVEVTA